MNQDIKELHSREPPKREKKLPLPYPDLPSTATSAAEHATDTTDHTDLQDPMQWGDVALSPLFMPRVTPVDPTEFDDTEPTIRAVDDSAISQYSEDEIHLNADTGKPKANKKGKDCKKKSNKRKKSKKPLELDWLGALSTSKGLVREVSKRINALREDCALMDRVTRRPKSSSETKTRELIRDRVDLGFKAIHPDFIRLIKTYNILEKDMDVKDVAKYSGILSTFISQKAFASLEAMVSVAMADLGVCDPKTSKFLHWKKDLRECAWVNLAHLHTNLDKSLNAPDPVGRAPTPWAETA